MIKTYGVRILWGLSIAALIGVSWHVGLQNVRLRASNRELLLSRVYPYPLASLELRTPETTVVETTERVAGEPVLRYLVLVSTDTCHFCEKNMSRWESLIRSLRMSDQTAVLMVVYGSVAKDAPLTATLKAAGIPYQLLQVKNTVVFSLKTGLVEVPTTLLLDARMRPILVRSGMLTDPIVEAFEQGVSGRLTPNPFFASGDADPVRIGN